MTTYQPRIAIIGAGPAGLALSRLLHQRGILVTVYELRSQPTQEELAKPSGMLDLHEESGLALLRECGLWEQFQARVGECSESGLVLNPQAEILHFDDGGLESRPEISRNALTSLLIQNVPAEIIEWSHKITGIHRGQSLSTGATELTIDLGANGKATCDFIVGSDGAWSRTRTLVSDAKPFYSGAHVLTATVRNVSATYPHLLILTGTGTMAALGGRNALMTQRGPQDSLRLYAAVTTPDENWPEITGLTATEIKTLFLADDHLFGTWSPKLKDLLSICCDADAHDNPGAIADIKPWYMLPVGHTWETTTGVTLVGDAAHLMTPWAGEGVNLALQDALDLAGTLASVPASTGPVEWQGNLAPGLHVFEETMLSRAREKAEETDQNRRMFLAEDGARAMADFFKAAFGDSVADPIADDNAGNVVDAAKDE